MPRQGLHAYRRWVVNPGVHTATYLFVVIICRCLRIRLIPRIQLTDSVVALGVVLDIRGPLDSPRPPVPATAMLWRLLAAAMAKPPVGAGSVACSGVPLQAAVGAGVGRVGYRVAEAAACLAGLLVRPQVIRRLADDA